LEMFGEAVVAADEASVFQQPGLGAFDHLAVSAEPGGRFDARAGEPDGDPAVAEFGADVLAVVGLVAVQLSGRVRRRPRRERTGARESSSGTCR
jgi:hypothetical protein